MSLQSFFKPKAVAIIGASNDQAKIGRQILDNILQGGFKGSVFPINLREQKIAGRRAYADLSLLAPAKRKALLVVIAIPAKFVEAEISKCAALGLKNIIIISSGFKESGPQGAKLERAIVKLALKYQLNILGPNCLGLTNANYKLNATFAVSDIRPGRIALLSQSGAIGAAALDWIKERGINLAYFISLGNKAVLSENEIITYLKSDPTLDLIVIYLESISEGEKLMSLISKVSPFKPVLILKAGQSLVGEKLALSHTGSLTGSSAVIKTGLVRAGAVILNSLEELFEVLVLFKPAYYQATGLQNLYLITNAGGVAVLTADELARQQVPFGASFDLLGDADAICYEKKLKVVLKDRKVNNLLVLLTPQTATEPVKTAQVIIKYAKKYPTKLIMASFIGGQAVKEAKDLLCHAGVPTFNYPEVAVRSFKKLVTYKTSLKKQRLYHILSNKNKSIIRSIDYLYSLALLEKYKIKTILTFRYEKTKAKNYQYPVVLKAVGPDFLHKTDKQAVIVNLNSVQELQIAADRIMKQQQGAFMNPDNYLVVQAMASGGQEIIMGFKRDLSFGVTMMIGWGGIYAEVLKEIKLATSDLNLKEARNLIKNLKIYPILNGIRGRQKYDIENLALALVNLAKLANDHPEIKEADINPLFVFKKGVAAADVRIII